jgi:spermidine/putrescine transport system substrate-binding protein
MDYGMTEKLSNNDVMATVNWNGSTFRAPEQPRRRLWLSQGRLSVVWMDNAAMLGRAERREGQGIPELHHGPRERGADLEFARYANGIEGSEAFMPEDMKTAPEIVSRRAEGGRDLHVGPARPEAQKFYTAIWTELQK